VHGFPTLAVTREGGQTTEAITTSTTAVDLLSASGLSIAAAEPYLLIGVARKTSGAAAGAGLGQTVNTTVVSEASPTAQTLCAFSTTNRIETGNFFVSMPGRVASYPRIGTGLAGRYIETGGISSAASTPGGVTNDVPTAQITDIVIRGISGDAAITLGADELQIYSLSSS
jgi:hypothetical protein